MPPHKAATLWARTTKALSVEEERRASAITQDLITYPNITHFLTSDTLCLQNDELHATAQYVKLFLFNKFNQESPNEEHGLEATLAAQFYHRSRKLPAKVNHQ